MLLMNKSKPIIWGTSPSGACPTSAWLISRDFRDPTVSLEGESQRASCNCTVLVDVKQNRRFTRVGNDISAEDNSKWRRCRSQSLTPGVSSIGDTAVLPVMMLHGHAQPDPDGEETLFCA